jgi:hypothetical protein
MNLDRLLREVEGRLQNLSEVQRADVLEAIREEVSRERRRVEPELTVEAERRRRIEAETLRDVLEAINRQARLEETIDAVLKQLTRLVTGDSYLLALLEADGLFRVLAARGSVDLSSSLGRSFRNALTDEIRASRWPLNIADVEGDPRFTSIEGLPPIRSWCGIPLFVEGEVIGLLAMARSHLEPFEDEDLHAAKALAFSAAAAIRKAQLLEQVRRYAALLEQVVAVHEAVFTGADAPRVARVILEGAGHIGNYPGGAFVALGPHGLQVAASMGSAFAGSEGRSAPPELSTATTRRLPPDRMPELGRALGLTLPVGELYLVPLAAAEAHVGTLALLDPDGVTADDRLMESYASRAASAYLRALRRA